MGLSKRGDCGRRSGLDRYRHWLVAVILLLVSVGIGLVGDAARDLLQYDRELIAGGEYWRLVSGHFAHLGSAHLLLNMAGLVLVWLLVGSYYGTGQWALTVVAVVAVTSAAFWYLQRDMLWYVGLSGVLHGLLLAGSIRGLRVRKLESALIIAVVAGKLAWEQFAGPLPGSESAAGGRVIVDAHWYGAVGGVIAALMLWRGVRADRSI